MRYFLASLFLVPQIALADPILFGYEGTVSTGSQIVLRGSNLITDLGIVPFFPKFELTKCKTYLLCKKTSQVVSVIQGDAAIATLDLSDFSDVTQAYGWWTDNLGATTLLPLILDFNTVSIGTTIEILPEPTAEQRFLKQEKSINVGGQVGFSGISFQ